MKKHLKRGLNLILAAGYQKSHFFKGEVYPLRLKQNICLKMPRRIFQSPFLLRDFP
jgi:hypothetical protein